MMRMVLFAYLSVARAEKSIPIIIGYCAMSFIYSIHLHGHSGWVIATIFTFPMGFLAWQSNNSKDLFGWRSNGPLVCFYQGTDCNPCLLCTQYVSTDNEVTKVLVYL
jgi:hypothetical protein